MTAPDPPLPVTITTDIPDPVARALATVVGTAVACRDCPSEVILDPTEGAMRAAIFHQPDCPWFISVAGGEPVVLTAHEVTSEPLQDTPRE